MPLTRTLALVVVIAGSRWACSGASRINLLERIAATIRDARTRHEDPVAAVREAMNGFHIWRGKVGDVERRSVTGFASGEATIAGVDAYDGRDLRIAILDDETDEPITTEGLRYGFRVSVLSMPCDPR